MSSVVGVFSSSFFDGEVAFLFFFSSSSPCMKLIVKDGAENSFHRATSACLVTCRPGERLEQEKSTKFNPGKKSTVAQWSKVWNLYLMLFESYAFQF